MPLRCLFLALIACLALMAFNVAQAGAEDKPAVKPADIDRLIKELGSNTFDEREAAQKALAAIGYPALEPLRAAAKSKDEETRRRATVLVEGIEQGLDNLLVIYQDYELPLPPKDVPLVKYERKGEPPSVAFLIEKGT